jgi:hypothetical protein
MRNSRSSKQGDGRGGWSETRFQERAARALAELDRAMSMANYEQWGLERINIRLGLVDYTETLVTVVMVDTDGQKWVGFNGSMLPSEAIIGAINRVLNDSMKWRKDSERPSQAKGSDPGGGAGTRTEEVLPPPGA